MAIVGVISSQNNSLKPKLLPTVAIGMGVLSFDGDIGAGLNLTSLSRVRGGYTLAAEQRLGKIIGVSVNGIYGKLADGERGAERNLNFESKIFQADLNLVLHLDNDLLLKRNSTFAPYLVAGFGFLKFNSFGDLKNKDGEAYNYWADGTIRSLPDSAIGSKVLRRDYTYETRLNDSSKYSNSAFAIPVGIGVNIKIIDKFSVNLGATYYFTTTDWIDNFKDQKNDRYIFANISLKYNLGNSSDDDSNPVYQTVDFVSLDSLDSDGDKVADAVDVCPGTPKDVIVTLDGCPEDSDSDGVPDYMDKEVLTIVGRYVDENGETITEKMFDDRNRRFNSQATERSQLFNENPSFKYLLKLEAKSRSVRKNSKDSAVLPIAMLPYDLDDDDYLSADELVKAIDSFFDGDSGVENLNAVIDYFFEQ